MSGISPVSAQNLTVYLSKISVEETTAKLENVIKSKDLLLFETVIHNKIAADRGVFMEPTHILLFEDPYLTSQLIACEKTAAYDLPLKIMVWEENDDTYIGYIDPIQMRRRFMIHGCEDTIDQMTALIVRIINETLKQR
ncbi:MAG: DUF302 domain-containing protein [Cyclobacteriaceae bacterium]|nr:DUF302 domain-containing protein [Cyclobacteriaceae bacterium]